MLMLMMNKDPLDLESFSTSHHGQDGFNSVSSDSDDGNGDLPRRTVDEILLDDDGEYEQELQPSLVSYPSTTNNDDVDDESRIYQDTLVSSNRNNQSTIPSQYRSRFRSSHASSAFIAEPDLVLGQRTSSLPTQWLFGGGGAGRTAKPGAALAAAAAASRPVPTHAAALIQYRTTATPPATSVPRSSRSSTGSIDLQQRESGSQQELQPDKPETSMDVASEMSYTSHSKLLSEHEHDDEDDFHWDNYQYHNPSSAVLVHSQEPITKRTLESGDTSSTKAASLDLVGSFSSPAADGYSAEQVCNTHQIASTSCTGPQEESILNLKDDEPSRLESKGKSLSSEEDDAGVFQHVDAASDEGIGPSFESDDKGINVVDGLTEAESKISEPNDEDKPTSTTTDAAEIVAKSDIMDLAADIISQLEHKAVAKLAEKKGARPPMKPLERAEELEKKHAFSGLDWETDIASQPMKLEGVRRGSIALGYFDISANNTITRTVSSHLFRRDQGSPQSVAVHFNFIAVGLSKGLVLVVPSKYSPHSADSMDAKMLMLGIQGDDTHPAVTSLCFNQAGDLLFAGYSDGRVVIWDLQKGVAVKVVTGIHDAPVVHLLYLGQDSQMTRNYRVVSGDSKGLVWLITFTVVPWVNRISFNNTCLLDGKTTGKALCASPLLPDEFCGGSLMSSQGNASGSSSSSIGNMVGGVLGGDAARRLSNEKSSTTEEGVVIFATYQNALVARVSPSVVIYAQLSRPDGVREGSMPYTAWKSMGKRNGTSIDMSAEVSEKVSLLAIAWDRKVQIAMLVKSKLKVYAKWTLESSAIGVAWLDDEMLVILTTNGQLCLFAKDGAMIHQTSFMVDGSGGDDLVAYHMHFANIFGNPEKAFHNCIAVRGATIYVLGPSHLIVCRLLPWKERIEVLKKAGDWMGALNMAMSLFDGQAHGVIDLPKTVNAVQETIMPYLVELLLSYVDEVFSYISVAFCNQIGKLEQLTNSESETNTVHSEIKEQFSRVGCVAVEFCVHIKRLNILFDEILSKFVVVQQRDTFLELLEPYILKDMLGSLPPEVMQALVEHYSSKGWLQRVEQCVLHMDISSLDFNQVVRLCREHRLYGALVYLFNKGLDDFRAPLEELFIVLKTGERKTDAAIGYRMLVYLKYCFTGLAFPPGQGLLPAMRLPSLRTELVQFLLETSNDRNSTVVDSLLSSGAYLNLYHLLQLDTEATLDVLRCAFVEDEILKHENTSNESGNGNLDVKKENDSMAPSTDGDGMVQKVVDALVRVLDRSTFEIMEAWPLESDIGHMLEFIAYYTSCRRAVIPNGVMTQILEYFTSDTNFPPSTSGQKVEILRRRERQVLALLEAVPEIDWDASYVLQLCEKSQFFQVCGLIHAIHHHYIPALDSFMKDLNEPRHAFAFISDALDKLSDSVAESFRFAVLSRIPDLILLSRADAFFLVTHHFSGEWQNILSELRSHPKSLFLYLKTVFENKLVGITYSRLPTDENLELPNGNTREHTIALYLSRISGFSKFLRDNTVQITEEMTELYVELLCQYEPNLVLKLLKDYEPYKVEQCLRLCQEYGVVDASAFLLEKVGDAGSALVLILSGLGEIFSKLDTAVARVMSDASVEHYNTLLKVEEVKDIRGILHASIGLCQRNNNRSDLDPESLWFQLLDSFCEPLLGSFMDEVIPNEDSQNGDMVESIRGLGINWKISKDHNGAQILRKLFSQFIKEIVEGMIGYVRLPVIMTKLLADNTGQEFGDFKLTILGMLETYGFERRILDTAKSLIEDDTFYTMSLLRKGASRGYAPRSLACCVCNCPLTRNNSSCSGIHLFSCGHACHLHCQVPENDTSLRGPSAGCPICMPTKNGLKPPDNTGVQENRLVSNSHSDRPQQSHGMGSQYPHETDGPESSHGFLQISRFEMLTSLKKDERLIQVESIPQLRLAPPAVYHEKVTKQNNLSLGESSKHAAGAKKSSKNTQLRDMKSRGSSIRLPLRSNIFGKEKSSKR